MENAAFEEAIKNAVQKCTDDSGWANLAEVGTYLRHNGVQYGKLSKFLKKFAYLVETKLDSTIEPPVMHARLLTQEVSDEEITGA